MKGREGEREEGREERQARMEIWCEKATETGSDSVDRIYEVVLAWITLIALSFRLHPPASVHITHVNIHDFAIHWYSRI